MNEFGTQTPPVQPQQNIPNYLVQSILVTLFCCLPLGIAAIVFAAQVNGKLAGGDITGAMDSSKKAKMFCWISFGIGLAGIVAYFAMIALGIAFGAAGASEMQFQ
ncbi:MAG: CD225/dispanin family protein [Phycisphaerae bacterium]|nr:CD225/dispanin family protein [Phycisphaerae bacterium]